MSSAPQLQPARSALDAGGERTPDDRRIFASLKEINTAAHTWQAELSAVLDAPPATQAELQAVVAEQAKRKPQIDAVVDANLTAIRNIFAANVNEHEWGADVLIRLDLLWKNLGNSWPPDPASAASALASLKTARDTLDDIIYNCTAVLLSPDINDRLMNLEIGQALDLNAVYGDGFPRDPAKCKLLLNELAQEQAVIQCGILDPDAEVIYRVAKTKGEQHKSVWRLAGWLLGGAALTALASLPAKLIQGWPISSMDLPKLLANYVFIFVGAGGHLAIDALKEQRSRSKAAFRAMDDWLLWLHVHERQVLFSILWADLGFILLSAMPSGMDWRGAFAAGYSIDSITDLFLNRFEATVAKAAGEIRPPA